MSSKLRYLLLLLNTEEGGSTLLRNTSTIFPVDVSHHKTSIFNNADVKTSNHGRSITTLHATKILAVTKFCAFSPRFSVGYCRPLKLSGVSGYPSLQVHVTAMLMAFVVGNYKILCYVGSPQLNVPMAVEKSSYIPFSFLPHSGLCLPTHCRCKVTVTPDHTRWHSAGPLWKRGRSVAEAVRFFKY